MLSVKPSPGGEKSLLVHSSTFLWWLFCSGVKPLYPFLQRKSIVLCSLSQQRIFPALTVAYCPSLFPPHFFIISWRSVGTNAKYHILIPVSSELNVQVLSSSYFYLLCLCLFTQRSWQFVITHVHNRSSHWFALRPETLITPRVTPFQLTPRPQSCRRDLYSAFAFIH